MNDHNVRLGVAIAVQILAAVLLKKFHCRVGVFLAALQPFNRAIHARPDAFLVFIRIKKNALGNAWRGFQRLRFVVDHQVFGIDRFRYVAPKRGIKIGFLECGANYGQRH